MIMKKKQLASSTGDAAASQDKSIAVVKQQRRHCFSQKLLSENTITEFAMLLLSIKS